MLKNNITMIKNIIYTVLLIIFSFLINISIDYQFWMISAGIGWCISGFLLIKNVIETKIKNK